ncbi:MAG: hypothetical protein DRR19_12795 [Candidatus Parabeggiatoa sp. nov. 1]|nr:MAG: hypothetical protein DRR19_12795 [Gammaproteobacteria bacterium]
MITEQDLNQIQDYVIQILPQLLRQKPEIATIIENIIARQFLRRDELVLLLDEVKLFREDTNRRFEQVDRHFELQREEMNRRFEQVEQRLREERRERLDIKRRMVRMESALETLVDKITQFDMRLNIIAGTFGTEEEQKLEEVFASALSYGLNNPDIKPETIRLRQEFRDTEGVVFLRKGKFVEIDLIAEANKLTVFFVAAFAEIAAVEMLARKVKLVELQNPDKKVQGIFISPGAGEEIKQCCTEYGLELLD